MKSRSSLTSPTLWLAAGMGLVVGLVCLLLGVGNGFGQWLANGYQANGFPELQIHPPGSVLSLFVLVIATFGTVLGLEGTPGAGRRVMLLLSGMIVFAMASPVLALWGIFWNPLILLIAVFWSGLVAMIHAGNLDRVEHQRIADENNVVRMNAPVSPNKRRKQR